MKRILVGYDGSPSSDYALACAVDLSARHKARILGVIVEDERRFCETPLLVGLAEATGLAPHTRTPLPPAEMLEAVEKVEQQSAVLEKRFEEAVAGLEVSAELLIERGNVSDQLIEHAKEVDFICMGRAGSHMGVDSAKEGATLAKVSEAVATPLLAFSEHPSELNTPVLAFDGSDASFRALELLPEVLPKSESLHVLVLTVGGTLEDAQAIQKPALDFLRTNCLTHRAIHASGDPGEEVLSTAEEFSADLIAMGAYGSGPILEFFCGSTTKQILRNAETALLLVP